MTHEGKRLSVIIPAFNAEASIEESLRSFEAIDCEIVVVDDGSTDRTSEVARQWGAKVIRTPNQGAAAARRRGATEATGEYLIFLDSDDMLCREGVLASIDLLDSDPQTAIAAGRVIGLAPGGKKSALKRHYSEVNKESLLSLGFGPWPPAAMVVRRGHYEKALAIAPPALETGFAEDYELILRVAAVGQIKMHDVPSAVYRMYAGKSHKNTVKAILAKEEIRTHYAEHWNSQNVRLLSRREALSAAYMKTARGAWARRNGMLAALWVVRAAAVAPERTASKLASSLLARVK